MVVVFRARSLDPAVALSRMRRVPRGFKVADREIMEKVQAKRRVPEVLLVGDAMAPRLLHDALLEGTRAARQL